ncbi:hypothetical protein CLOP_g14375 [Closterium sp. NIES-67]|nr:hypothetical protein CLOP_g14375 [Closterium sp. NIES-67]
MTGDGTLTVRIFTFPLPADESPSPRSGLKRGREHPDDDDDDDDGDGDDEVQGRERPSRSSPSPSIAGGGGLSTAQLAGQGSGSAKSSDGPSRNLSGRLGESVDAARPADIRRVTSGGRLAPSPVPRPRGDLDLQGLSPDSRFPQPTKHAHTTQSPPPLTPVPPALPRPVGPQITQRDRVHMSFARGPQTFQTPPPLVLGGSTGHAKFSRRRLDSTRRR